VATVDIYWDQDNGTDNTDAGRGDTSGSGAYQTLDYAIGQRAEDLTTSGDIHHYHGSGTNTDRVTLDTYTTDVDNYVILDGGTISVAAAYQAALWVNGPDYTRVRDMTLYNDPSSTQSNVIRADADNCVFERLTVRGGDFYGVYERGTDNVYVNLHVSGSNGSGFEKASAGGTVYLYNSTVVGNGGAGVYGNDFRTIYAKNVYSGGNTGSDYDIEASGTLTDTTCYSEDGTESTSTAAYSTSSGAYFTSITAGSEDIHLASTSSTLYDAGTDLSADATFAFSDDIDGDTRSRWDVGADEYVSAGGATLTLADLLHTQSLDTVSLTQKHNLAVADLQQTQSLDTVSLTQAHNLAVAALLHSHSLDTTALTQKHSLVVDELLHTQTLDATALTQKHSLILADLLHTHSLDGGLTLTSGSATLLVIADLLHSHGLDEPTLTQKHQLVVADAAHTQSLDGLTLSQKHQLVVAELLHSHGLDPLELSFATSLVVDDLTHSHSIDGVDLVQAHVLQVDRLGQTHRLDDVSLSQKHLLALQDLLHTHRLDRVNFDIATGVVTIAFSAKTATVTFTSKAPSVSWESNG